MRPAAHAITSLTLLAGAVCFAADNAPLVGNWPADHAAAVPLSLRSVRLDGFFGTHVEASNDSLLAGLESPIPRAFEARAAGKEPPPECKRLATDSDFYKWLEAACYALAYEPERKDLKAAIDRHADDILRIQQADGYIGTRLSPAQPFDEKTRHDLYVAGHMIEAAVAHFEAIGTRKLLDAAIKFADFYLQAYRHDHPYFKLIRQEHPEIELALVRLGRATGEPRFITFAADLTRLAGLGPTLADVHAGAGHRHAVRVGYQLTGAAELVLQTGDPALGKNLLPLWQEIADTRMYVTGGMGYNEVIPDKPFDLPQTLENNPNRDIAETCASVAMMMFSWRMHGLTAGPRSYDVLERILYNHFLGATSPDHKANFYYNPLRRVGDLTGKTDHGGDPVRRTRLPKIHSTACCLPNAWRFCAQLPEYVFSAAPDRLFINLYTDATAHHHFGDDDVTIKMKTDYPHAGAVQITVTPSAPRQFTLSLRIPGWCHLATVSVNGGEKLGAPLGEYYNLKREWHPGDRVDLMMTMTPVAYFSPVETDRRQLAFRRGPLIYCLEKQDAAGMDLQKIRLVIEYESPSVSARDAWDDKLHFHVLKAEAREEAVAQTRPASGPATTPLSTETREITLIPFYYRANRADDTRWLTLIPFE